MYNDNYIYMPHYIADKIPESYIQSVNELREALHIADIIEYEENSFATKVVEYDSIFYIVYASWHDLPKMFPNGAPPKEDIYDILR